jgi:hypothetical protein
MMRQNLSLKCQLPKIMVIGQTQGCSFVGTFVDMEYIDKRCPTKYTRQFLEVLYGMQNQLPYLNQMIMSILPII